MDAVTLVSSAVLGIDIETVFIGGRVYTIPPPTVRRFAGAVRYIKEGNGNTLKDIILSLDMDGACKALSWLIQGDEGLYDALLDSPVNEVMEGVIKGFGMIDPGNFTRLSALQRNVRSLVARPRS